VVHNLRLMKRNEADPPYEWAQRFESKVRESVMAAEHDTLINIDRVGEDARLSVPTPEHYLPLLYVIGLQGKGDVASVPVDGIENGSLSMLCALVRPAN